MGVFDDSGDVGRRKFLTGIIGVRGRGQSESWSGCRRSAIWHRRD